MWGTRWWGSDGTNTNINANTKGIVVVEKGVGVTVKEIGEGWWRGIWCYWGGEWGGGVEGGEGWFYVLSCANVSHGIKTAQYWIVELNSSTTIFSLNQKPKPIINKAHHRQTIPSYQVGGLFKTIAIEVQGQLYSFFYQQI